jgi:hypothetical protein
MQKTKLTQNQSSVMKTERNKALINPLKIKSSDLPSQVCPLTTELEGKLRATRIITQPPKHDKVLKSITPGCLHRRTCQCDGSQNNQQYFTTK